MAAAVRRRSGGRSAFERWSIAFSSLATREGKFRSEQRVKFVILVVAASSLTLLLCVISLTSVDDPHGERRMKALSRLNGGTNLQNYREKKYADIFDKMDLNGDKQVSQEELSQWIYKKTIEHFARSENENEALFRQADDDGDGFVTWDEYHIHFLISQGLRSAADHSNNHESHIERREHETILQDKFRFSEADKEGDHDGKLNPAQYLVFAHPERNGDALAKLVSDTINTLDSNSDGMLSCDEYAALPPGVWHENGIHTKYHDERTSDFKDMIDKDKDGLASFDELLMFLSPNSQMNAAKKAKQLMNSLDSDMDRALSLKEVLDHKEQFRTGAAMDIDKIHEDF